MKKINVIVKDRSILELTEDASSGDIIDLQEIVKVDTTYINTLIEQEKEAVYAKKLENEKKKFDALKQVEINDLNNKIELIKKDAEQKVIIKEKELENKYSSKILELEKKLELLDETNKRELSEAKFKKENEINEIIQKNKDKYQELEQKYNNLENNFKIEINQNKLELENKYISEINQLKLEKEYEIKKEQQELENQKNILTLENEKRVQELKENYQNALKEKDEIINGLQRSRAVLNVKQTGEDLEAWCNNEVISYMQNGLFNCTWEKDNTVVRNEDDVKGSKADYIFKIYVNEKHQKEDLLTSVCLEMKDENPDSTAKKKNADYTRKLEENRIKKDCKYSVLVSNLETDKPNDLPIYKVLEYENMYVVRPAYLMVFLNMITSLTTRFSELILNDEKESLALKTKYDLIEEFRQIKETYLDKPLENLNKTIDAIIKSSETIKDASRKIDENCEKIKRSYISAINDKLSKFELKLEKNISKKLD